MDLGHRFWTIRQDGLQAGAEAPAENDHVTVGKPPHSYAAFPMSAAFSLDAVWAELCAQTSSSIS